MVEKKKPVKKKLVKKKVLRRKKKKPKTSKRRSVSTTKPTQKQKQYQIVNVYYDKGGRRNVVARPIKKEPEQPKPLVLPVDRYITSYVDTAPNFKSNQDDRQNQLIQQISNRLGQVESVMRLQQRYDAQRQNAFNNTLTNPPPPPPPPLFVGDTIDETLSDITLDPAIQNPPLNIGDTITDATFSDEDEKRDEFDMEGLPLPPPPLQEGDFAESVNTSREQGSVDFLQEPDDTIDTGDFMEDQAEEPSLITEDLLPDNTIEGSQEDRERDYGYYQNLREKFKLLHKYNVAKGEANWRTYPNRSGRPPNNQNLYFLVTSLINQIQSNIDSWRIRAGMGLSTFVEPPEDLLTLI